ncbi:uncharacterized protein LOC129610562 [Condylostylus longicornis]|uniref:uncharacterized protein LOC129610562 n=1 Tax=Condylostylus longicornis TaxID=2530218 RepID=UPI00244DA7C9|nr:uncharacterized protein LOC129610562 [Condylostylus longicornis]
MSNEIVTTTISPEIATSIQDDVVQSTFATTIATKIIEMITTEASLFEIVINNETINTNTTHATFDYSKFLLTYIDYGVIIFMLLCSTAIGIYFGFFKKSENTTDEYLMGSKNMKTWPIAISLIASQLSANSIITMPSEIYSYGLHFLWCILAIFPVLPIYLYIIIPVFYNNNITNCYEYLEMRFDKKTRGLLTFAFLFKIYLMIPVYIFVPSLSFSQVTGLNLHLINVVICSICVFYTMIGGIKAVVWTDVVQAFIMFGSVIVVALLAMLKLGSLGELFERANSGGRLYMTNLSFDLTERTTFWNCFLGSIIGWMSYVGLNQSCVQRIVALPSIDHAKRSLTIFTFGCFLTLSLSCLTGVIMYAWYYECDPVKAGVVEKSDKLMPFFVQDIIGKVNGMPGLFISCVFSAALSTMSACLNTLAGVIYFDLIRPHIKHTESKANFIMKIIVILNGVYCVLAGFIVEQFDSLLQIVFTIIGVTQGCVGGVFLIGMLLPKVNARAIFIAALTSFAAVFTLAVGSTIQMKSRLWKYQPLDTSVQNCEKLLNTTLVISAKKFDEDLYSHTEEFSIFKISFYWYTVIGALIVLVISVPLSICFRPAKEKELDINLFPPIIHSLIKDNKIEKSIEITKMKSILNFENKSKMAATNESVSENVEEISKFVFNIVDYTLFLIMLCISAGIGIYFGFFEKHADTTDEYLMGSKKMKTIPIAISLIASQLSALSIMTIPVEIFSFGLHYFWSPCAILIIIPALSYVIVPVFYNNNISNCYEYLEMRFNSKIRKIVTLSFIIKVYFLLPVYIFIPSLAFSQVTGFNIHLINIVVCSVCIFYTMVGGIKAVVWTDVVQALVMLGSVVLVTALTIIKIGGFEEVFFRASYGGRLYMTNFSFDLTTRATFWNCFVGSLSSWMSYVGVHQSCVQRIVSLPSLSHARNSLILFGVGCFSFLGLNVLTGIVMYARYHLCDPIKAGFVDKADKLVPFFVQDVIGHFTGMPGLFISAVFCAALSTMSANLNTLAGLVYFDYIKPKINHTESRANLIMKTIVVFNGIYCILGGFIVQKFNSIFQVVLTISGVTQGAVVGIFLLGMLYPKAHSKAALVGVILSMVFVATIAVGTQAQLKAGLFNYEVLPTSIERCEEFNSTLKLNYVSPVKFQNELNPEGDVFSIFKVSFYWYNCMGSVLVWLFSVPLSHLIPNNESKKLDRSLLSPVIKRFIPKNNYKSNVVAKVIEEIPLRQ